MKPRAQLIAGGSAFLGLCAGLLITTSTVAQVADKTPVPTTEVRLRLSLLRDLNGDVKLYLAVDEATLHSLLDAAPKEKRDQIPTFLSAEQGISYREVVKAIDMLGTLGLHRISLDTKHTKNP